MATQVSLTSPSFLAPASLAFRRLAEETEDNAARLTGGRRILRAADDASSLSLAQRLKSQEVELKQSSRNVAFNDTLANVASSALGEIKSLLEDVADLADQANSTSLPDTERAFLQQELAKKLQRIDEIAEDTTFNDKAILDGSFSDTDIVVGGGENDTINLAIPAADSDSLFSGALPDLTTQAKAATAETQIADALEIIGGAVGALEGVKGRLLTAESNIRTTLTGVDAGRAALEDINVEQELQAFTLRKIQVDIASATIAQARQLSSDLLDVLNFPLPETTGQEDVDQAETKEEKPSQPSTETNAPSFAAA